MTSANNNGALLTQSGPQAFSLFAVQYKKEFNAVHKIQQKYRPCISIHLAENLWGYNENLMSVLKKRVCSKSAQGCVRSAQHRWEVDK